VKHASLRSKSKDWLAREPELSVRVERDIYPRTVVSVS